MISVNEDGCFLNYEGWNEIFLNLCTSQVYPR